MARCIIHRQQCWSLNYQLENNLLYLSWCVLLRTSFELEARQAEIALAVNYIPKKVSKWGMPINNTIPQKWISTVLSIQFQTLVSEVGQLFPGLVRWPLFKTPKPRLILSPDIVFQWVNKCQLHEHTTRSFGMIVDSRKVLCYIYMTYICDKFLQCICECSDSQLHTNEYMITVIFKPRFCLKRVYLPGSCKSTDQSCSDRCEPEHGKVPKVYPKWIRLLLLVDGPHFCVFLLFDRRNVSYQADSCILQTLQHNAQPQ